MSSNQNFKDKLFTAKALDVEFIVLTTIEQIMLAPTKIAELGDYTKVNRMEAGLVLKLDAFVSRILLSDQGADNSDYKAQRLSLISVWEKNGGPNMEAVNDLFKLTIEAMQHRRLFKLRRMSYFGMRWKKNQVVDLEKLQKQEEIEGDEPSEEGAIE